MKCLNVIILHILLGFYLLENRLFLVYLMQISFNYIPKILKYTIRSTMIKCYSHMTWLRFCK